VLVSFWLRAGRLASSWRVTQIDAHTAVYDVAHMDDHLSTREVGWVLGHSAGTVRDMIVAGDIEASRIVSGYRIPKAEVLRLGRARIEAETDRKLSDAALERLIDEVIETNRAATSPGGN
jgi:excisionase family DNA binding protein